MQKRFFIFILFMFAHFSIFSQNEMQKRSQETDKLIIKSFIRPLGS
jgi:hypothetical protein